MEIWDLYNAQRELTGLEQIRGEEIPQGYYHLVVHVWIKNSKGEYLISQRSADRTTNPLKWECVGGSVLKGEKSLEGALREVKEEVGLTLFPEDGNLLCSIVRETVNGKRFADIVDVWSSVYDGAVDLNNATTKEVADTAWMTKQQVKDLFENGDLVQTLGYFFDLKDI